MMLAGEDRFAWLDDLSEEGVSHLNPSLLRMRELRTQAGRNQTWSDLLEEADHAYLSTREKAVQFIRHSDGGWHCAKCGTYGLQVGSEGDSLILICDNADCDFFNIEVKVS
jgi:hypothetical protein